MPLHELLLTLLRQQGAIPPASDGYVGERWRMTIPAKTPTVGDLTVWDDVDELTVEIGEFHHRHFSERHAEGDSRADRDLNAAKSAAEFIHDVLNDLVRFRVEYTDGRVRSSSSWYPIRDTEADVIAGNTCVEFCWSRIIDDTRITMR